MRCSDKIVERIIEVGSDKKLIQKLFAWQGELHSKYAYAVYGEDSERRFIEGEWSNDIAELKRWLGFKEELKWYLKRCDRPSLIDILFFLDMNHRCRCYSLKMSDVCGRQFKISGVVNDILRDSQGFLLWHYQMENLVRLFYLKREDVKAMTEGLIFQKPEHWTKAKRLKLTNGAVLQDILKDRLVSPSGTTIAPRIMFASNLYKLVNESDEVKR